MVDALDFTEMLVTENRHVGQHRQRVDRGRRRLGGEHVRVADAHPRLLAERGFEIDDSTLENSTSRTAQARIVLIAHLRQGRRRRLAKDSARAANEIVVARLGAQLEGESGIVVLGQKSEEEPPREHQWRRVMTPTVLGETAYCRDRTDARQLASVPAGNAEDRVIPHAVARLRGGESDCRPMGIRKPVQVGR